MFGCFRQKLRETDAENRSCLLLGFVIADETAIALCAAVIGNDAEGGTGSAADRTGCQRLVRDRNLVCADLSTQSTTVYGGTCGLRCDFHPVYCTADWTDRLPVVKYDCVSAGNGMHCFLIDTIHMG
ncbi:MAG: hypothetical protein IKS32_04675 [Solobacterium sp.]|nr:hypothetical protein [Solobacterium sp.]